MLVVGSIDAGSGGGGAVVILRNMPTSCTGKGTGTLWNNAGTVGVCP
jgi:hypothetical protein